MSSERVHFSADNEQAMLVLGRRFGAALEIGSILYLQGDLGVGKTTLCRGILAGRGYRGNVKSPTYTLIEPYDLEGLMVYHFDLYRLVEPSELEYVGYRDYFDATSICLVEWPDKAQGLLPEPDLEITIIPENLGRQLQCHGKSEKGCSIIKHLLR